MLSFILVFSLSCYFITNIYQKWSASPIIIGLNPVATSISDIPFPAVTICNMNQARKSVAETFTDNSAQKALLKSLCQQEEDIDKDAFSSTFVGKWSLFKEFLLNVSYIHRLCSRGRVR